MSDQIQRDDGEWQMLLNNAYSMVDSLTNRVEARDAQIESLQRENEELRNREQALGEALRFHGFTFEFAEDGSLKCGSENAAMEELARRAITPEMKGRIIKMAEIDDAEWDNFLVENGYPPSVKPAVTQLISDLRDFLGEQG